MKLTKDDLKAKEEVLQQEACLANQEKLEAVKKFECLSNDFLELQFKLTDVEEKNVVISTKCQELQGQCILLSDMRETYETQINNLETCLLECKEMLQRTTAENEELKRTVEKSEIRKNEMEDHSKLQELEEQLRSVMEENVNLVEKVQTAETRAALLEQEKCRLLSDLQEDSEKQISELRRSLFECQEIMKNSIAEKEAVELKLDHSEKLRNEMEDLLSRDQAEKHSNSLEVKCEVEQLNNSLQHFKRENAELVEKSKCIINENECLQQKIQELETKAVLLQTSYNELCCKNQNLEVESEELQRTVDGLNNHLTDFAMLKAELSAKLEALNVVKNANEFLTHQVNETVSNELSLKNVVEKQRAVLEDIYGVVLSVNSEQEMKSTLPKDFQLEDILPALKRRFAVENVKVSEDKVVNTDLDENYVSSLHCIKIKDLVNEYTQAARALSELETVLQTLESRVSTCEANDRFINKHSCPAHRAETRDVFTEVEEEIIIDGTRAAPLTSHMLDTSEVNLCSTTLTRDTLERIDKFTEIIEGELTVESFRNDADHCECSCEHCALISQRLTDNNEQPKLFIEKLLSNVQILRSDRNVIDNSLRNFVRRFQELKFDGDSDICSDEVEKIKLKLDEVMISAGDSSEVDLHRELNHLDDVLTILLQCEKVVLLVLQTWNTAIHCKSLKGEEIKTKENIEIEELQRTNEMQEKKIKEVEDLVNKFKIVAVKAKKETAELKKRVRNGNCASLKTLKG